MTEVAYPFRQKQTRQHGVDANLRPDGDGQTFDELELRGFGYRVGHAGAALADCLGELVSMYSVFSMKQRLHTATDPVVIICPPSGFASKVSRASERSALGTLTFADQHCSRKSALHILLV